MPSDASKYFTGARRTFLICLGLVFATVLVYWRVGGFDFLNYDDPDIFLGNPYVRNGLAWKSVVWGATTFYYEYWHPLMWWSHMLDCQLFGLNAGPHHLVNLAFHVINSLLAFAVFRRMTGMVWRSAIVAALFALHPLHVESVAWLAERKDLLSTSFWLLSLWAYARYVEDSRQTASVTKLKGKARAPEARTGKPRRFYSLAWLFFLLGLLSKPMVVTLPFVLLLLDYWPLNRISDLRFAISDLKARRPESLAWLVWEKWPFFGLSALFCFITWYTVKLGNHFLVEHPPPPGVRYANIPISYVRYLWKTIYPCNLAVLYPMPGQWPWWQVAGAILILVAITWLVLRAQSARYLVFGWLMFLGILVPTIGIVQVGAQAMADRYMYLPSVGLFAAAVWAVADFLKRGRYRTAILGSAAGILLTACAWLSWIQVQHWRNSITLWRHCLAAGYESVIAHQDLGRAYLDTGDVAQGLAQYQAALKLDPDDKYANQGFGVALVAAGRPAEATNYLARALRVDPDDVMAHENLGLALTDLGDFDGAIAHFSEAIRLAPVDPRAYAYLGKACSAEGKSDDAMRYYLWALQINPEYAAAHYYLGIEYLKRGSPDAAVSSLESAVKFGPAMVRPQLELAGLYSHRHETARAIAGYRKVLRLNPDLPEALNNLAWLLATTPDASLRNGAEAVQLAQRACEKTAWQQALLIGTLAAAYAEAGDFDQAVQTARKACDTASAHGENELLQENQALMAQYKNRQPCRDTN